LQRLIERFERIYPFFATAVIAAAATAALIYSPLGRKAARLTEELFTPDVPTGAGFLGKVRNDWGFRPDRFLYGGPAPAAGRYAEVDAEFAERRTARPLVYSRDVAREDLFVIVGAFEFKEGLHGALLLDRKGRVLHRWLIPPAAGRDGIFREDYRLSPHGFALARDGTAIVAFDNGERLIRIDPCGREMWRKKGGYHHVVATDPERPSDVWTWHVETAVRLDRHDGRELEAVRMPLVEAANPELDLLRIRERDRFEVSTTLADPIHYNDIDPLPAALADRFPQFSPGDLLISARSLNLIFVVDRKTRRVKWHASGYWRRQHDPDWGRDGRIYVFNNNLNRGLSSIVAIDPQTRRAETVIDGARYDFYTNIRGKQQWGEDGRVVLASSQQGRALEIDERGEISFEFLNYYDARTGASLVLFDAFRIAPDAIDLEALKTCSG
jgi:hypothetical protein